MACKDCRAPRTPETFYESIPTYCRECWKARVRLRRRTNPAVREYDRERAKQPERRAKARSRVANWRKKFPDKYQALTALGNAIRDKKAKRGHACIDCGSSKNLYGVHADYSKPLEVTWRCALCYRRATLGYDRVQA